MSEIFAPGLQELPLDQIDPSPTNPRKSFDPEALGELANSIAQLGVMTPILVRPRGLRFEIVAGERRFRAARQAELATIPAIVRELDDTAVLELQVVENLQREGLHPLEEAEGYEQLRNAGLRAETIAERIGKSRSYVFARLKLCALCEPARKLFRGGALGAEAALLVARIPVASLQMKAVKEISRDQATGGAMSYRAAVDHIRSRYTLTLADAPFDLESTTLAPQAGRCSTCIKNTACQPEIFSDLGADVCTDPDCFATKKRAHIDAELAHYRRRGWPIIEPTAQEWPRWKSAPLGWEPLGEHLRLNDGKPYTRAFVIRDVAGKVEPTVAVNPHSGDLLEVVDEATSDAAIQAFEEKLDRAHPAPALSPEEEQAAAERRAQRAADAAAWAEREALRNTRIDLRARLIDWLGTAPNRTWSVDDARWLATQSLLLCGQAGGLIERVLQAFNLKVDEDLEPYDSGFEPAITAQVNTLPEAALPALMMAAAVANASTFTVGHYSAAPALPPVLEALSAELPTPEPSCE